MLTKVGLPVNVHFLLLAFSPVCAAKDLLYGVGSCVDGLLVSNDSLLVAAENKVSFYELNDNSSIHARKVGSFHPSIHDDDRYVSDLRMVSDNSFVYCGEISCR